MSEMIERIAVWFCRQRGLDPGKPVWTGPIDGPRVAVPTWTRFASEARELIAEMREPTEAMIKAAPNLRDVDFYPSDVWRAMIDGALREPHP